MLYAAVLSLNSDSVNLYKRSGLIVKHICSVHTFKNINAHMNHNTVLAYSLARNFFYKQSQMRSRNCIKRE